MLKISIDIHWLVYTNEVIPAAVEIVIAHELAFHIRQQVIWLSLTIYQPKHPNRLVGSFMGCEQSGVQGIDPQPSGFALVCTAPFCCASFVWYPVVAPLVVSLLISHVNTVISTIAIHRWQLQVAVTLVIYVNLAWPTRGPHIVQLQTSHV